MYDRKKNRSAQNVTDVSFFVVLSVVTMGYSRDPLVVCFGDQLASSVTS